MELNHSTDILVFLMAAEGQLLWVRSGIQNGYGLSKVTEKTLLKGYAQTKLPKVLQCATIQNFSLFL